MKYENGIFKLLEVKGDERNIPHYDYSGLSIDDIRHRIYDYTGKTQDEVDYKYTEAVSYTLLDVYKRQVLY